MFVWADAGIDTSPVAQSMLERGYVTAPGSLFSPDQRPSTWMRFNLATTGNPRMLEALEATLARARQRLKADDSPR
jgi:DNA-binding transcriptional MocR family regulator